MEASSRKQVGENSSDEQSHETSTKTDSNCSLIASDCLDAGPASDQLAGLTENFSHQLTVGELEAETFTQSEHASSRPNSTGRLLPEGMFNLEDPRPVSPKGASSMKIPISHSMDPPNHPAVRVVCQGNRVIAMKQENGKPAENTEYHNHSSPVGFGGQQTTINSESDEMRKAKEVYCDKLEKENKELKKDLEKKASEVQALERKIEFLEKCGEEFEKRMLKESKKETKLKQQLNLWKRKCKELKGKLAQEVKTRNGLEKRSNDLCKENNTLLQNATFLTKNLRQKTEALGRVSLQCEQVQQNLQQFRDEVLGGLQDAQTTNDELRQLLEESAARELEKAELIRKQKRMYHWKEDECQRLKEHIEEKNQQYQNTISEIEKLKKETFESREELKTGMVELNRVLDENSRKHQERLEEASQAFLKAETDLVKEMKSMLAKEKQRVKRLKRAMVTLKISGERIKKRNENLHKVRNRQLLARVNDLSTEDKKSSAFAGSSSCCKARDDEQSWSTDSDEEEWFDCQPDRALDT